MLYLLTMFQQNAEQERISAEERQRVIESTLPETFRILDSLHNQVSIQSIDDIGALGGIVIGLQMLSETDSAKEAQNWLYELPAMYYHQLVEENLVHKNSPKLNNI